MSAPAGIKVLWFLPTHGDGRYLGSATGGRLVDIDYLRQVAQAADSLGYYGVLLPTGRSCEDSWVVASALALQTRRLRFLVAVRPGLLAPTLAARMTATLDRISGGRLLINVVTGGDPVENAGDGVFLPHDERYEVTEEFLDIYKGVLSGETLTYEGTHLSVRDGQLLFRSHQRPHPPLYFGGSSDAGIAVAAKTIDKYLTWGEPPADVERKLDKVREAAARENREVSFGIRLHVIVRETQEEAWTAADRLISHLDDETIARAQKQLARQDSIGQTRMRALHGGDRTKLEISPNLWAGVGLVRGGAGTALVGDPDTVAERIDEYRRIGIDTFIFSGYPHLEEAYSFGERVLPKLPLHHGDTPAAAPDDLRLVGETIANTQIPEPKVSAS